MRRTPLYEAHVAAGARMVDFSGWEMPVQYAGILEEAKHVRSAVGLFDLCHMGRLEVRGPEAVAAVDATVSCNTGKLPLGVCKYGLLCNEAGGVIDDVLVYRDRDLVHVIVNAGNRERDFRRVQETCGPFECEVASLSDDQTMLALQGPRSEALLQPLADADLKALGYYRFTRANVAGVPCLLSRTGYTGEDGFELFFAKGKARAMWDLLLAKGKGQDLRPIGLGARDTLRTEAGMPLYGHEMDEATNPLEAGLAFGIDLGKAFPGAAALRASKEKGLARRLVGLRLETRRIARPGAEVRHGGKPVGKVTSGTHSPTLDASIAMAFVPTALSAAGGRLQVEIRGEEHPAEVIPLPFYKRKRP